MAVNYEFRTAAKWFVYEALDYVEQSPPVFLPYREGTERRRPPGGALIHGEEMRREYDPLVDEPEVWLYFANLRPDDVAQMVKFARRFGLLGLDRFEPRFSTPFRGEYVEDWKKQILTMKALADVYRDLLGEEVDSLARRFQRHARSSDLVLYIYDRANSPKAPDYDYATEYEDKELVTMGWGWQGFGDLSQPLETARRFIADVMEQQLYGHLTPIIDVSGKKPIALVNVPSLLGAMYMQVWLAVASGAIGKMQQCPSCGRWFRPTRRDRIWCDDYCGSRERMRRYRQRQAASSERSSP